VIAVQEGVLQLGSTNKVPLLHLNTFHKPLLEWSA
jgi:hypothetical protein